MRHLIYCETAGPIGSAALLVVRLVMGAAFVVHGWPKIQNPSGWMGAEAAMPGILQALAAVSEFGGGAALVLGLLTRLACLGIGCVMVTAISTVHVPAGHPFVGSGGPSYELAAVYLACAVLFVVLGPGRFSLDALFFSTPAREQS